MAIRHGARERTIDEARAAARRGLRLRLARRVIERQVAKRQADALARRQHEEPAAQRQASEVAGGCWGHQASRGQAAPLFGVGKEIHGLSRWRQQHALHWGCLGRRHRLVGLRATLSDHNRKHGLLAVRVLELYVEVGGRGKLRVHCALCRVELFHAPRDLGSLSLLAHILSGGEQRGVVREAVEEVHAPMRTELLQAQLLLLDLLGRVGGAEEGARLAGPAAQVQQRARLVPCAHTAPRPLARARGRRGRLPGLLPGILRLEEREAALVAVPPAAGHEHREEPPGVPRQGVEHRVLPLSPGDRAALPHKPL
mmetsp:Transcript_79781/g.231572  ORF Transcript_79781/g.231572 Transcript_79781/m.231572 type:complete len:312 (+) Transcript_79781:1066-2001(+)